MDLSGVEGKTFMDSCGPAGDAGRETGKVLCVNVMLKLLQRVYCKMFNLALDGNLRIIANDQLKTRSSLQIHH